MDKGTYSVASAGLAQFRKLEVVNNNLANSNTPGFKKEVLIAESETFDQTLAKLVAPTDPYAKGDQQRMPAVVNTEARTDFSPGPIKNTGNPLDVALRSPNDFFVISTPDGEQYTRAGNFTLNEGGDVVTVDGQAVLGEGGQISTSGPEIKIGPDGSVRSGNTVFGKVRVAHFDDPSVLERVGNTRFKLISGSPEPQTVSADLEPQALEMSNVSAINSMLDLIVANRGFDMYTRAARTIDEMNQQSIGQVGRRR